MMVSMSQHCVEIIWLMHHSNERAIFRNAFQCSYRVRVPMPYIVRSSYEDIFTIVCKGSILIDEKLNRFLDH